MDHHHQLTQPRERRGLEFIWCHQALRVQSLATFGPAADAVSTVLISLAAALTALKHRQETEEHPVLGLANDVQAVVALARLGLGTDVRGRSLEMATAAPGSLNLPLMGRIPEKVGNKDSGRNAKGMVFSVRNT